MVVACLWHIPQGGLHIWRIKENSFRLRRVLVQATERILRVDLAAIQRKLLALQRGVSDSAAYNPASNGVTSELDDEHEADNLVDLKKIEVM